MLNFLFISTFKYNFPHYSHNRRLYCSYRSYLCVFISNKTIRMMCFDNANDTKIYFAIIYTYIVHGGIYLQLSYYQSYKFNIDFYYRIMSALRSFSLLRANFENC